MLGSGNKKPRSPDLCVYAPSEPMVLGSRVPPLVIVIP